MNKAFLSRLAKAVQPMGIMLSTTSRWPSLSKGAEGGIVHLVSADNGAYYCELWGRDGGSYYAVTGAAIYQMPGLAKGAKLNEALDIFLREVVGKAEDGEELPDTAALVKALSMLKKSVRALDKHETEENPEHSHDPHKGKGKTEERHPGKFESSGAIGEKLHQMSLEGGPDEECGSHETGGSWYGLMTDTGIKGAPHAILTEDNQGFVDFEAFKTAEEARAAFAEIQEEEEGPSTDSWAEDSDEDPWPKSEEDRMVKGKTARREPKRREAMWKAPMGSQPSEVPVKDKPLKKHETPGRPHTDRSSHWHQSVEGQSVQVPGRKSDARIYQTPTDKAEKMSPVFAKAQAALRGATDALENRESWQAHDQKEGVRSDAAWAARQGKTPTRNPSASPSRRAPPGPSSDVDRPPVPRPSRRPMNKHEAPQEHGPHPHGGPPHAPVSRKPRTPRKNVQDYPGRFPPPKSVAEDVGIDVPPRTMPKTIQEDTRGRVGPIKKHQTEENPGHSHNPQGGHFKPTVHTERFEWSHGKKPRGTGGWAFQYDDDPKPHFIHGSYADAKRQAMAEGRRRGASRIHALP